eukprot:TRINITY_DN34742_c1_g1_i1.p1 TRINITY_DN34742_c1_g1~~TRINITY_DN34742_c1_g1_i1.p1  ORF type:complete len:496 (+),score=54.20 TRINITY_DN34742_c1_g1_i1:101-1588(+)
MFQAAAGFAGGVYAKSKLDEAPLPSVRRADDGTPTFTLSVRILGAHILNLGGPGLMSHQRPFFEVALGNSTKTTEFADFVNVPNGKINEESNWRFGDTFTFKVKPNDIFGQGIKLSLRSRQDIKLGPMQVELAAVNVGEGLVHLKDEVLSNCTVHEEKSFLGVEESTWTSPTMPIPLLKELGLAYYKDAQDPCKRVAQAMVAFSIDIHPGAILTATVAKNNAQRPFENVAAMLGDRVANAARWVDFWLPGLSDLGRPKIVGGEDAATVADPRHCESRLANHGYEAPPEIQHVHNHGRTLLSAALNFCDDAPANDRRHVGTGARHRLDVDVSLGWQDPQQSSLGPNKRESEQACIAGPVRRPAAKDVGLISQHERRLPMQPSIGLRPQYSPENAVTVDDSMPVTVPTAASRKSAVPRGYRDDFEAGERLRPFATGRADGAESAGVIVGRVGCTSAYRSPAIDSRVASAAPAQTKTRTVHRPTSARPACTWSDVRCS